MLEGEEDHIGTPRRVHRGEGLEPLVGERTQLRVHVAYRLPRLAPARGHPAGHVGMTQQETEQLAAGVAGRANHGDAHGQTAANSVVGRSACHRPIEARTTSTSASASRRALNAGSLSSAFT